jgi:hypothetical protein
MWRSAVLLVACNAIPAGKLDRTAESNLTCVEDYSKSDNPPIPLRTHCLAPPWTTDNVEGLTHVACGTRAHVFTRKGTRKPKPDEELAFLERHRKEIHAMAGVNGSGYGLCCSNKDLGFGCVRITVDLCTTRVDQIASAFATWASELGDADLAVSIELAGAAGPRCDGTKACGPQPYPSISLARAGYRCDGPRTPLEVEPKLSWGRCAHDGECSKAGCGNQCVPWTEAHLIGTCEGRTNMENAPAFCGCVEGACTWFVQ